MHTVYLYTYIVGGYLRAMTDFETDADDDDDHDSGWIVDDR